MSNDDNNAMSPDELYREENYTDQKTGAIRKLIPVLADGSETLIARRHFMVLHR